jgi:hypothetical protein
LGANREAANLYAVVLHHADTAAREQKVGWLEKHAFASYLSGFADAAAGSWREAITLRHEMGNRLEEGDNLRLLSRLLWPLGRLTEAVEAGRASLRLLEDLGPSRELAWALVNSAQLAAHTYDPACAGYAARAITLGSELGEPAVVIQARGSAALATVWGSDTGWDELEAAWRDAMATEGLAEHAGLMERSSAGPRHCTTIWIGPIATWPKPPRSAPTTTWACSGQWPSPPTVLWSSTAVIGTALARLPRMC